MNFSEIKFTGDAPQATLWFANGYGAFIVELFRLDESQPPLYAIAVIRMMNNDPTDWHMVFDTPVTSSAIGQLTELDVMYKLEEIDALPGPGQMEKVS